MDGFTRATPTVIPLVQFQPIQHIHVAMEDTINQEAFGFTLWALEVTFLLTHAALPQILTPW